MSILSGYKKFKKYIKTSSGFQLQSLWTSANTVEADDKRTIQTKVGAINGISSSETANSAEIAASTALTNKMNGTINNLNRDLGGLSFGQDADGNWGYKVGGADSVTPFKYSVLGSYIAGSSLHNMKTGWLPIDFCDTNIASLSNGELIFKKSGLLQVRIMASISVDNSLENNIVQLLVDGITHVQKNLKGTTTSIEIESSIPVSVGTRVGCKFKQETGRSFYCMSSYIING